MKLSTKSRLLSTTVVPFALGVGLVAAGCTDYSARASACSPCYAAACNPCAARACNPCGGCNPCAASACNPCGAGGGVELTDAEARDAYNCAKPEMVAAYSRAGIPAAAQFGAWTNYANTPYPSGTHGGRLVNNYANSAAGSYAQYENAGTMPAGAILAKDSFSVNKKGQVVIGPLFLMAKMDAGFNADTLDWQYQMVMPDGSVFGTTNGPGSAKVQFCADCHNAMSDQDAMWLLPEEYRR